MPNAGVCDSKRLSFKASSSQISWLALTLTPGLGPTRAKRVVDFFGNVESVFNASLTQLEARRIAGAIRAVARHRALGGIAAR